MRRFNPRSLRVWCVLTCGTPDPTNVYATAREARSNRNDVDTVERYRLVPEKDARKKRAKMARESRGRNR